jgi:hypothetical protein
MIGRLRERNAGCVRLAEEVSLAVRVERALLRAVRLRLRPRVDVSAEADLWFSPLVQTRTPDWLVLEPNAARELRRNLARDQKRLRTAHELVVAFHRGAPATVVFEDELIWLDLLGEEGNREPIARRLRSLLHRVRKNPAAEPGLVRWFAVTANRFPRWVMEIEEYSLAAVVVSAVLSGRAVGEPTCEYPQFLERLTEVLPEAVPRVTIWAALTAQGLMFRADEAPDFAPLEVPQSSPLLLAVGPPGGPHQVMALGRSETHTIQVPDGAIEILTAAGDCYRFRPRLIYQEVLQKDLQAAAPDLRFIKPGLKMLINRNFLNHVVLDPDRLRTAPELVQMIRMPEVRLVAEVFQP